MRSYFLPRMVVKIQVIIDFDIFYLPLLDLANLHFFRSKKLCDNLKISACNSKRKECVILLILLQNKLVRMETIFLCNIVRSEKVR